MKENVWINVEDYKPSVKHRNLLVDTGESYQIGTVGILLGKKTIMNTDFYGDPAYSIKGVKRVMILSRK